MTRPNVEVEMFRMLASCMLLVALTGSGSAIEKTPGQKRILQPLDQAKFSVVARAAAATDCIFASVAQAPNVRDILGKMGSPSRSIVALPICKGPTGPKSAAGNAGQVHPFGDLIVEAAAACVAQIREMIDACDTHYEKGAGEAFFMGPYLDHLPQVLHQALEDHFSRRAAMQ